MKSSKVNNNASKNIHKFQQFAIPKTEEKVLKGGFIGIDDVVNN